MSRPCLLLLLLVACGRAPVSTTTPDAATPRITFAEARRGFTTRLVDAPATRGAPPEVPPAKMFSRAKYPSPVGELWVYATPDPGDGKKHPAVVWVHGGFDTSIESWVFQRGERANDQSAAAFREAGVILVLPSFRGGNDNPGRPEMSYGEVDDLLAAVTWTRNLPYVDPERVYLGGHSTGATIALLAAAAGAPVRTVLALGSIDVMKDFGVPIPFDTKRAEEWHMRSPVSWMADIRVPTLVLEGEGGFADAARNLARANPNVTLKIVPGHNHFSVVAPAVDALARRIAAGEDPLAVTDAELR